MKKNTRSYAEGLAKRLRDPAYAADYLTAAAEEGKVELLLALRDVAQATGVGSIAKKAKRGRESLYKALSRDGNPALDTFLAVLRAVNVKVHFDAA